MLMLVIPCLSCSLTGGGIQTVANSRAAAVDPGSMTYSSPWLSSGRVTLSHGEFREPAAPDSASEVVVKLTGKQAFGIVNGKETGAVVLATATGGTGTFYDLALLTMETGEWVNTDMVMLGDRVKVSSIEIDNDGVVVNMTTHGPRDPACCPTLEVKKRYAVKNDRLVPAAEVSGRSDRTPFAEMDWQWVQTLYNDGKKYVPSEPKQYTIRFRDDGTLKIRADCNLKGGRYAISGNRLSIEITQSTMAACPDGSLEDRFVRDLSAGARYFLKDGNLYIDLKYDSGTMKLSSP